MFAIFYKSYGVVQVSYFDKGVSVDHKTYLDGCIKPMVEALKQQRPMTGVKNMKFHHDNARPHVHSSVIEYLKDQNLHVIEHPPYSPDLAPSDFWLFGYIKQRLGDYPDQETLATAITDIVSKIPENEWLKTFRKWIERMELCVKYEGDYFEHIIEKN